MSPQSHTDIALVNFDIMEYPNSFASISITPKITVHIRRYLGRSDGELLLDYEKNVYGFSRRDLRDE